MEKTTSYLSDTVIYPYLSMVLCLKSERWSGESFSEMDSWLQSILLKMALLLQVWSEILCYKWSMNIC